MSDVFQRETRTYLGTTRDVWVGGSGPGVVVMHEIPGLHPGVIGFGEELVAAGFTVWMPDMFGDAGRAVHNPLYMLKSIAKGCVSREFTTWRTGKNSAITDWLRQLAKELADVTEGRVGAVGMCFTGGFALAMMVDEWVGAPVLSQPSLPFGVFPWQSRDLGIDDDTLRQVKDRCKNGCPVLGLRYSGDRMVPRARFDRLREELGDAFESIEAPSEMRPWRHSVLTLHRHEPAVTRVLAFFREHTG